MKTLETQSLGFFFSVNMTALSQLHDESAVEAQASLAFSKVGALAYSKIQKGLDKLPLYQESFSTGSSGYTMPRYELYADDAEVIERDGLAAYSVHFFKNGVLDQAAREELRDFCQAMFKEAAAELDSTVRYLGADESNTYRMTETVTLDNL